MSIDLKKIIEQFPDCITNGDKLKGILSDLYASEPKGVINTLVTIVKSGIAKEMQNTAVTDLDKARWKKQLEDVYALSEKVVENCLALWLSAIVVDDKKNAYTQKSITKPSSNIEIKDGALLQQLIYVDFFLSVWVQAGPEIWSFTNLNFDIVKTNVKLNGRYVDSEELSNQAIDAKRSGNYAEAVGAYIQTMAAYKNEKGRIPVALARGLFKVLVCVNYFYRAYILVSTVYADMKQIENVDEYEVDLFKQYFLQLVSLAISVVKDNDFTQVAPFAENYSGSTNYVLQRTPSDIKKDMNRILENIRTVYGKDFLRN